MQAFTKGPTVPAFKLLVESFTDIEPNITESVFGNWILGRDHLHPNDVKYEGVLEFRPGRFEGGLMFNDDVVVNIPAVSNINLNEGTISAWIRPEWSGIDDDATITVTIDDLGVKRYNCKFNDDIFSYNDNFNVFSSEDAIGGVDSAGGSVTIHNFKTVLENNIEEDVIGAFALIKEEEKLSRITKSKTKLRFKIDSFTVPEALSPPRRRASEDLSFNEATLGIMGLGKSLSDVTRGTANAGSEIEIDRICSPGFISIGDEEKLIFILMSLRPKIQALVAGNDNITYNEIPEYDRYHITKNCQCGLDYTAETLEKFRDDDFNLVYVNLDSPIDLAHIALNNNILDKSAGIFKISDTYGSTYNVVSFISDGKYITDTIPSTITGFVVDRIPINKPHITAMGSAAINSQLPTGELTLLYQTFSILTGDAKNSKKHFGYSGKNYTLDWMTKHVTFDILREPLKNKVEINITNKDDEKYNLNLFYTDLIDSN